MCQDLENKLSLAEKETVQIKAENFKLLKSLASTNNNHQTNDHESTVFPIIVAAAIFRHFLIKAPP